MRNVWYAIQRWSVQRALRIACSRSALLLEVNTGGRRGALRRGASCRQLEEQCVHGGCEQGLLLPLVFLTTHKVCAVWLFRIPAAPRPRSTSDHSRAASLCVKKWRCKQVRSGVSRLEWTVVCLRALCGVDPDGNAAEPTEPASSPPHTASKFEQAPKPAGRLKPSDAPLCDGPFASGEDTCGPG